MGFGVAFVSSRVLILGFDLGFKLAFRFKIWNCFRFQFVMRFQLGFRVCVLIFHSSYCYGFVLGLRFGFSFFRVYGFDIGFQS